MAQFSIRLVVIGLVESLLLFISVDGLIYLTQQGRVVVQEQLCSRTTLVWVLKVPHTKA